MLSKNLLLYQSVAMLSERSRPFYSASIQHVHGSCFSCRQLLTAMMFMTVSNLGGVHLMFIYIRVWLPTNIHQTASAMDGGPR